MGAAKKEQVEKFTASDLIQRIRIRFPSPAWGVLEEVRNGTGFKRDPRTADAIAMSTWPSLGLEIHGFEVKVSRGDWKRELEQPGKAAEIQRFCDRWWVVAAPGVVGPAELPPTWGLLEPRGKALAAKVEAPKLEAEPITRLFLASLFRSLHSQSPSQQAIDAAVAAERKRSEETHEALIEGLRENANREAERLKKAIDDFEAGSGVHIDRWNGGAIGGAVKLVLDGGLERQRKALLWLRERAEGIAEEIRSALANEPRPSPEKAGGG